MNQSKQGRGGVSPEESSRAEAKAWCLRNDAIVTWRVEGDGPAFRVRVRCGERVVVGQGETLVIAVAACRAQLPPEEERRAA